VAILADDLIWATRLADLVRGAGAVALPVRSAAALEAALPDVDRVVIDLTARAYDGVAAIDLACAAGRPVLAVGQHDDADLRRRALAAGADRVHPYRRLFEDGPRQLAAWLDTEPGPDRVPAAPTPNDEVESPT
jgi:CheY-like chemotaxis protein